MPGTSPRTRSTPGPRPRTRAAAGAQAVVVMSGPSTAQEAIAAGIVNELRLHVRPILLGAGIRLLDGLPSPAPTLHSPAATGSAAAIHLALRL
jgi:riboflavin biosynthesis pyrimidine reductase